MARKGFWKGGVNFLQELDRIAGVTASLGPKRATERIVRELQQEGPSWTGRFSNSWQIAGPDRVTKGDGQPGEPRPIYTPSVTGRAATRSFGSTDKILFTISNFSAHSDLARDLVTGNFYRPTETPQTQLGMRKWQVVNEGRRRNILRGEIGGGKAGNESSRTAPLDWFTTYVQAGKINEAVRIEMDAAMNSLR
jgi:hypothetical protein